MNNGNCSFEFPRALKAPGTHTTAISASLITEAIDASRRSPRGRVILPFHKGGDDTLQRMLNALQPGSYIQPHRHGDPPKAESIIVLRGAVCHITFSDSGAIEVVLLAGSNRPCLGIDMDAGRYHTFFAIEPDTVLFEVKPGPFDNSTDKQFAPWAPTEDAPSARDFLAGLEEAARQHQKGGEQRQGMFI